MDSYFVVVEKSTGRIIANCGDESDAIMLVSFDNHNRIYRKQKFILDQVIDITSDTDKQLPGQLGLPAGTYKIDTKEVYALEQGDLMPVVID
jgi:hypothetical protein